MTQQTCSQNETPKGYSPLAFQGIGIDLDEEVNRSHTGGREGLISKKGSRPAVYVIPTDEELLIARDTVRCVLKTGGIRKSRS
jgi:acetate kinase